MLSTISLIFILAIFTGGIYAKWGFITETLHSEKTDETMLYLIFLFFIYYLINYAAIIFFNLALVHCTLEYINGAKPSLRKGIAFSLSRIVAVLSWALISATVAIILKIIEEKSERISDFITDLLGAIWSMLAFFVLSVMAYENLNVFQAIKRSGSLFKKTWGERVGASFAFGFIYIIFFLLIALPAGVYVYNKSNIFSGIIVTLSVLSVIICFLSSAETVFKAGLYQYAIGAPVGDFSKEKLSNSFV